MRWDYCYPIHDEQEVEVPEELSPEILQQNYEFSEFFGNYMDYKGTSHKTQTGVLCQSWASQVPHKHDYEDEMYV